MEKLELKNENTLKKRIAKRWNKLLVFIRVRSRVSFKDPSEAYTTSNGNAS